MCLGYLGHIIVEEMTTVPLAGFSVALLASLRPRRASSETSCCSGYCRWLLEACDTWSSAKTTVGHSVSDSYPHPRDLSPGWPHTSPATISGVRRLSLQSGALECLQIARLYCYLILNQPLLNQSKAQCAITMFIFQAL